MKIEELNRYKREKQYESMSDEEFDKARHDAFMDAQNSRITLHVIDNYVTFGLLYDNCTYEDIWDEYGNDVGLLYFFSDFPETDPCRIEWKVFINECSARDFFESLSHPITIVNVGKYWLKHIDSFAPLDLDDWSSERIQAKRNERKLLKANIKERIEKAKNELELTKKKEKSAPKKKEQPPMLEFAQEVINFAHKSPNNAGAMSDFLLYLAYKNRWPHTETEKYMKQIPFNTVNINQFNMGNGLQTTNALPESN